MKVHRYRSFVLGILFACISAAGCLETEEDDEQAGGPGDHAAPDAGGAGPVAGGAVPVAGGDVPRTPAVTELQIGRDIYVGVFEISLRTAKIKRASGGALSGTIAVDFVAENHTGRIVNPFGYCSEAAPRLELAGETINAKCDAPPVPALARGEGTLSFPVGDANLAAAYLRTATLRVGGEGSNQIEVPFAKLDQTVALADVTANVSLTPFPYRKAAVTLKRALVTYSDWSRNSLLPEGKAHMQVELSVGGVTGTSGRWSEADTTLLRPDGTSSVVLHLNEWVDVGYRGDLLLTYPIDAPVSGKYTLTFGTGAEAVVHELVVP